MSLFKGIFRLPLMEERLDVIVIGDWGLLTDIGLEKSYRDVIPCVKKQIQQNPFIAMTIFTGDIAYDLQGPLYRSMFQQIQFLTSAMVFMVTPGNHDTQNHADTFQLFTASFYTPHWKQYYNYFYTFQLGNVVFISYDPEQEVFQYKRPDRIGTDVIDIFDKQFTDAAIDNLASKYFTVAFSHYPIYCSNIKDDEQSCTRNVERLKRFREYFRRMKLKLYLSGHLHLFERSKPICANGSFVDKMDNYTFECPVYVIQGAAGNDYYVQTEQEYPAMNYSGKMVYNTGFGLLSIINNKMNYPASATYRHISTQKCEAADSFTMVGDDSASTSLNRTQNSHIIAMLIKMGIVSLGIVAIIIVTMQVVKYKNRKDKKNQNRREDRQGRVEMVEQNFQTPHVNQQQRVSTSSE